MSENAEIVALFNRAVRVTEEHNDAANAYKEDIAEIKSQVESAGKDWGAFKALVAEHCMNEGKLQKKREHEELVDALRHDLGQAV